MEHRLNFARSVLDLFCDPPVWFDITSTFPKLLMCSLNARMHSYQPSISILWLENEMSISHCKNFLVYKGIEDHLHIVVLPSLVP